MNANAPRKARSKWPPVAAALFGAAVLLYFMALVYMPAELVCANAGPTSIVIALGVALSLAYIGGDASVRGTLHLPVLQEKPIVIGAVGGIAAFLIILLIAHRILSCPSIPSAANNLRITRFQLLDESAVAPDGLGVVLTDLRQRGTTEYRVADSEQFSIALLFMVEGYKADTRLNTDLNGLVRITATGKKYAEAPLHSLTNVSEWRLRPSVVRLGANQIMSHLGLPGTDSAQSPIPYFVILNKFTKEEIPRGLAEIIIQLRDGQSGSTTEKAATIRIVAD